MGSIADRLMQSMKINDLTYLELSKKTGISKSALQRYATGETEKIPLDRLETMAKALDVSASYLMGWSPETPDPSAVATAGLNEKAKALLAACQQFSKDDWIDLIDYAQYLQTKRKR